MLPAPDIIRRKIARAILTFLGVSMLGMAGWQFSRTLSVLTWPEIQAEVTSSRLTSRVATREERVNGLGSSSSRTKTVRTTMYGVEISLRYTVNGQQYNTRTTAGESSDRGIRQEVAQRYAPGTRHPIRYDPSNPVSIQIEVSNSLSFFAMPLIFGTFGTVLLLMSLFFRAKATG